MIITLIKKEWARKVTLELKGIRKNLFGTLFNLIIGVGLFTIIIYVFCMLNARFIAYGVSDKLLMFFLGLIIAFYSFLCTSLINKNLYDSKDLTFILSSPIKNKDIVISKFVSFYGYEFLSLFPLVFALFLSYGLTNNCQPLFYVMMVLSLFITPVFVLFFGSFLSLPYHYIRILLKNYSILQLIISVLLVAGFSYLYSNVLRLFIDLINDGRLSYLFNQSNIDLLDNINKAFFPSYFLVNTALNFDLFFNLPLLIVFFLGSGASSIVILMLYYRQIRKHCNNESYKRFNKKVIVSSSKFALVQKEIVTFFRNSNYLFVYCTFLLSLGFINYAICSSLKLLVNRFLGSAFTFFPFALLVLVLFASIINGIGANVISKEKQSAIWIKTMPISYREQIGLKYSILLLFMGVSLLIATIMMGVGKLLNWYECIFVFISSFFLVASVLTMIVKKDIMSPNFTHNKKEDNRINYSLILSFIIPLAFALISIVVFFLLNSIVMLITTTAISILFFVLFVNGLIKGTAKKIQKMEVGL